MAHISGVLLRSFGLPAKPAYFNLVTPSLVVLHSPFCLFLSTPQLTFAMASAPPTGISFLYLHSQKRQSIYSSARRVCWDALPPGAHSTLLSLGRVRIYITGRDLVKIEGHVTAKTPHPGILHRNFLGSAYISSSTSIHLQVHINCEATAKLCT